MNTTRTHFRFYLLLLFSTLAFGQHKNTLTATINAESNTIDIVQHITYANETGKTLNEIYFNDWNHAFSGKNTPLAKRFAEEYRRNFHLARKKKRGNTTVNEIGTNAVSLDWERLKKQEDIIKVTLKKSLQPNESITIDLKYQVKLPSEEFTRYGYKDDGDFNLKYWYITPAAYKNGWKLYSNKNLDDLYTEQAEHDITFIFPKKFKVISNADTAVNTTEGTIQLSAKNVKEITVLLRQNSEFKTFQTNKVTITTNLGDFGLDDKNKAIAIDKVVQFIHEKLGDFPRENMMISKIDNKKNPVYGLGQLPSFIRPFTDDFQYEMKVLKAILTKNLEESMWMDTRTEKWISDALETYMLMVYAETFYPNMKLTGGLSKVWGVRSYEFAKLEFNDQYPFLFMLMARKNIDQPLSTSKDSLIKFNNNIGNKYKAGVGLKYLKSYFDNTVIDDFVKEFYTANRLKKSSRSDFENLLQSKAPKNIDWYFDNYVDSRKRIDYKIRKVEKTDDDSLQVTIKNKYSSNFPISLFGIKNDSVVSKYWITDVNETKTVTIPREGVDRLVLNYDKIIPEFNQRDNWKSLNGFFANNKKLKFTFFKDAENPHYNQIFFVPIAQFNLYDGFTPGMRLYNKTFLTKRLLYDFKPSYGMRSKQLVGSGSISYRHDIESTSDLYFARFSMSGNYYNYEENLTYTRLVPKVTFGFRNPDFRSNQKEFLDFRYIIVQREQSTEIGVENEPNYNVFNARYVYSNPDPLRQLTLFTDFQLSKRFSKIAFNLNYRKLFQDNRQLNVRFFFGKFLFNDTNSDFFSYALDRPTDYLFDYNYYGRSEDTGLFSQQLVVAEGGFKSKLENPFSNDWIGTANASYSIWRWIEGYADIGFLKNNSVNTRFVYDSGIRLNLVPDYFELYIPVYSNNGWEIAQPGFDERIRFIVTLSPKTLTKLFTRKWF